MLNIAAGLSTFPYRHTAVTSLERYAEFDLPAMIAYKQALVAQLQNDGVIHEPPVSLDRLACDLTEDIAPVIDSLGWDWSCPTAVLMEGISYYVPYVALSAVIRRLGERLAPGSVVVFDYFRPKDAETQLYQTFFDTIAPQGELLHTFYDANTVVDLFAPEFRVLSDRLMPDIERSCCEDQQTIEFASYLVAERVA